jgi:hypothetical protein
MHVLIFVIVLLSSVAVVNCGEEQVVYVESEVDHSFYLVQEKHHDATKASNLLATITRKVETLRRKLQKELHHEKRVRTFLKRSESTTIQESYKIDISATSYSVNKGENIVLCLRSRDGEGNAKLIDVNTLFYIVVHELAHVMSDSVGHTKEFGENFKFLLSNAIKWKLYTLVDYRKHPTEYCGLKLSTTPIQLGFGRR